MVCTVADSNGSKSCEDIVGYFTSSNGTGAEIVRYDPIEQHYKVNWKTGSCPSGPCAVDLAKTYRIRVLVGTIELGFTDVLFVSSASQLKNSSGEVTALMDRGTLPITFRIEKGAVVVVDETTPVSVGIEGGKVSALDGAVGLEVPAGALASTQAITVKTVENPPAGGGDWSKAVDLGPDGTTFSEPVSLSLAFDPEKLPEGVAPDDLGVFTLRDGAWELVPGGVVSEFDNTVTAPIEHFSTYIVRVTANNASGDDTPYTMDVGQETTVAAFTYGLVTTPTTYCYRGFLGKRTCRTTLHTDMYPASNMVVGWTSTSPQILQFTAARSVTDAFGKAISPPVIGRSPGVSDVFGTAGGAISPSQRFRVMGKLSVVPRRGDLIAGWQYGLRVIQRVASLSEAPFAITNRNTLRIAKAGTANYIPDGTSATYSMPAGSSAQDFAIAELRRVTVDTVIASGPHYLADTAIISFVKGKLVVSAWPSQLVVGDSVAVNLSVADQAGQTTGTLAQPSRFPLTLTAGLVASQGSAPVSDIPIDARTSEVFYIKAIAAGNQEIKIVHPFYETYYASVEARPRILGSLRLLPKTVTLVAGWSNPLTITRIGESTQEVKVALTSLNRLYVTDPVNGNPTYGGQTTGYYIPVGSLEKALVMIGRDGVGTDTLIAEAPGYLPDTAVVTLVKGTLVVSDWPAKLGVGDSAALRLSVADAEGNLLSGELPSSQGFALTASSGLVFSNGAQPITAVSVLRQSDVFYVKAVASGTHTLSFSHRDYVTLTKELSVTAPVIDPFPGHGNQLVVTTTGGVPVIADVPIRNLGTGSLRNMSIKGAFVANCYSGQQVTWITATFTEGVDPVTMHLKVVPPSAYPIGQHDFCYTLSADGATDRSYGVRLVVEAAPVIDPFPQAGHQLVVTTRSGVSVVADVPIRNPSSGSLRNMSIKGGFVANCYNGQQVNWITATFTEGIVPVIMHLKVTPASSYPIGQHDFCYTLAADGALDRSYGVRLVIEPPLPGQNVTLDDLGTFGGTGYSEAISINDAGRVVGQSNSAAFYRDPTHSALQYIPNPYGDLNGAYDVNAAGLVVGHTPYVGWTYNAGTGAFRAAPPAFPQTNASNAFAINNTGQVLGCADNGSYAQVFIWTLSSNVTTLIPHAVNWCAGGINDAGFAVASADPGAGGAAWLWNPNTRTATQVPSLGGLTAATDINGSNIVVGWSSLGDGSRRAFRYDPATGEIRSLGTLGGAESVAIGINDSGAIVGWSNTASGEKHAFVWFPVTDKMQDLGTLVGHDESSANEINGNNVAVGYSSVSGVHRAVRWTIK